MFRKIMPLALTAILAAACGGSEPETKTPAPEPVASASAAPTTDMPAPAPTAAAEPAPAAEKAPEPAPVKIAIAPLKFKAKKGKAKAVEIKDDGSIQADGKPVLKINGDHIEDAMGKTVVTLGADGALTSEEFLSFKFEGDDIVGADGSKVSVGEDGTVTGTFNKKTETWGKFDSAGSAKKTAALVSLALYAPKAAPAKAEATKTGAKTEAPKAAAPKAAAPKAPAK